MKVSNRIASAMTTCRVGDIVWEKPYPPGGNVLTLPVISALEKRNLMTFSKNSQCVVILSMAEVVITKPSKAPYTSVNLYLNE